MNPALNASPAPVVSTTSTLGGRTVTTRPCSRPTAPSDPTLTTGTRTISPNAPTASPRSDRPVNHLASRCDGMKIVTRFTISRNPGSAYTSGFQPMSRDVVICSRRSCSSSFT